MKKLGSRVSISSTDSSPQSGGVFDTSSRSLVFECVNLGG